MQFIFVNILHIIEIILPSFKHHAKYTICHAHIYINDAYFVMLHKFPENWKILEERPEPALRRKSAARANFLGRKAWRRRRACGLISCTRGQLVMLMGRIYHYGMTTNFRRKPVRPGRQRDIWITPSALTRPA
jgi:hypothetical protein